MARLARVLMWLVLLVGAFGMAGCGSKSPGRIPVDSPIVEFQPPDTDDLESEEDEDGDYEIDDGEGGAESGEAEKNGGGR